MTKEQTSIMIFKPVRPGHLWFIISTEWSKGFLWTIILKYNIYCNTKEILKFRKKPNVSTF